MVEIKLEDIYNLKQHFTDQLKDVKPEGEIITQNHHAMIITNTPGAIRFSYHDSFFGAVDYIVNVLKDYKAPYKIKVSEYFGTIYFVDANGMTLFRILCLKPEVTVEQALSFDFNKGFGSNYQMFQKIEKENF